MKYGVVLTGGEANEQLALAEEVEKAGWDGVFLWEGIYGVDPYVTMGAIAARTKRVRIGTMLTPASRRQPWKLASEMLTIDQLSQGRAIVALGLGATDFYGWKEIGEETDRKIRAELVDETIDLLTSFWGGETFSHVGKHYPIVEYKNPPPSLQRPRIPIWVVGAWKRSKSMNRVLRCDGFIPYKMDHDGSPELTANDIREMKEFIAENRTLKTPFDIVVEGKTPGADPDQCVAQLRPWRDAGVTWWIEARWDDSREGLLERVRQGPPRLDSY